MTPADMAALHAQCFTGAACWSEAAFASALAAPGAIVAQQHGGFVLGRVIFDEAELLTIAVPAEMRGRGVGRALLVAFEQAAQGAGADRAFLEVRSDNRAALALYLGAGWRQSGQRRGYYGPGLDALILTRDLRALPGI
jgi:ribosomal-protein-alanine N-acetyltransferase